MRVCGLLVLEVFVLVLYFGSENEVSASPVPDPCTYFNARPLKMIATTQPPKTEEQKIAERKRAIFEEYWKFFQKLFWDTTTPVKEPEQPIPRTVDMNSFFSAYVEFLTKFFKMFQ